MLDFFYGFTRDNNGNMKFLNITFKKRKVVTNTILDQDFNKPKGTTEKFFNQNKNKFIENEDYFEVNIEDFLKEGKKKEDSIARWEFKNLCKHECCDKLIVFYTYRGSSFKKSGLEKMIDLGFKDI